MAVGEHAVDLAPQHVEAPFRVRLLGARAREAGARPVDAGALADARLARGLGAAPPRPRLPRRERPAPRGDRASKFLPAAVAEEDLDDAFDDVDLDDMEDVDDFEDDSGFEEDDEDEDDFDADFDDEDYDDDEFDDEEDDFDVY